MPSNRRASVHVPRSLSLRLALFFVPILVAAAVAVGFLFDRGRVEALKARELESLRLHAERVVDEVSRHLDHLRQDTLFLAQTPPVQGIVRTMTTAGRDRPAGSTQAQWSQRLQRIFLAFAETRPEYLQLRLIGARDSGRELVRVERTPEGLRVTPPDHLQRKGNRYYFQMAMQLRSGSVYLSQIDLNREYGKLSIPYQPTLRAVTPIHDDKGRLFGAVVVNMDIQAVFEAATSNLDRHEHAYIVDEQGNFLLHPDAERTFRFEFAPPYRLEQGFPQWAAAVRTLANGEGTFVSLPRNNPAVAAYATARALDSADADRRFVLILAKGSADVLQDLEAMQRDSLIITGGLLALAAVLVVLISQQTTSSLSALATASEKIADGNYHLALPDARHGEVGQLAAAFGRMVTEVERREQALVELNRSLERRVEERTREIADQHALQRLIIENVADGIVVTDCNGRFLLWNRKAEDLVGSGPDDVPPEHWPTHFGIFRDEDGDLVPTNELPLVRAMRGNAADSAELFLRPAKGTRGRWVQVTARPLRDADNRLIGGIAALLDVTEQKRLRARIEEHRSELHRVGHLALTAAIAASAAHHLSQPIAAIGTYARAALRLQQNGRASEALLSSILANIERLSLQSGETLDGLRSLIRRRKLPPAPIEVNTVAESCLQGLKERIKRDGVKVRRRYGDGLPRLMGDPIELEQALIQLVGNALDAMSDTPIRKRQLCISTFQETQRNLLIIEIEDTGPGVTPELKDRLFEPWVSNKPDALGLGLSIAQRITDGFNGRIHYEKAGSSGALFRLELPAGTAE